MKVLNAPKYIRVPGKAKEGDLIQLGGSLRVGTFVGPGRVLFNDETEETTMYNSQSYWPVKEANYKL